MEAIHAPPNVDGEMKRLWVFVSVDSGGEGLLATVVAGTSFPMVTSSERNLARFKEAAPGLAKKGGKKIRLIEFTAREVLMEFDP